MESRRPTSLLEVRDLVQEFAVRTHDGTRGGGVVQAVSGVSFDIQSGETLGLVGETGSGKSTLARAILQIPPPKSGQVWLNGSDLTALDHRSLRQSLRSVQMVFQDPFSSMNPTWRVWDVIEEPLVGHGVGSGASRRARANELLELVGLTKDFGPRRPRQLSGGQCQRVAIARALALEPSLVICDEAVSALDVLVQAQVLALFQRLRRELGLSYLFIAHDLAVVRQVSDRVAVMYLGKLCEVGPVGDLYGSPLHPYTAAILASIPNPDPYGPRIATDGLTADEPPSPLDPPSGCRFRTRCPRAQNRCAEEEPIMRELSPRHAVACHFPLSDGRSASTNIVHESQG